jgi:predicted CXXCH cytochrome family protein
MADAQAAGLPLTGSRGRRKSMTAAAAVLVLLPLLGLACSAWGWRDSWLGIRLGFAPTSSERPLAADPRYPNTAHTVKYTGDSACARCHPEITRAYRDHPMGRSLHEVRPGVQGEGITARFERQGLEYTVEPTADRVIHRETRRDSGAKVVSANEAVVRYVIGSGQQALAFVAERGDGTLWESPITWYPKKQTWDLSPGYENDNPHFERLIKPACLFCHSNRFDHVKGTENRYRSPTFHGESIGCERCHGPGELHVQSPRATGDGVANIVNPASLPPTLRDSVCEQCHLQGDIRILRLGRDLTDFRPGFPLADVETVFVKTDSSGRSRFFGQVEQMHASHCFRQSAGRMGCISCHDPHQLPDPKTKQAYYRDRCLDCHATKGCSLPATDRAARGAADGCIDCHMPKSKNQQVPHTATTQHMILRFNDGRDHDMELDQKRGGDIPLVRFPVDGKMPEANALHSRELGVALATRGDALPRWPAKTLARMALPMLEAAVKATPDDAPAWRAKGTALWLLGQRDAAIADFRKALDHAPDDEESLVAAGVHLAQMGRKERQEALHVMTRAIAINPDRSDYHQVAALLYSQHQEWLKAIDETRKALALNAFNHEARMLLVQCLIKTGKLPESEREFATLQEQHPPNQAQYEAWFARNRLR